MGYSQKYDNITIVQIFSFHNPVTAINPKPVVTAGLPFSLLSKYSDNLIVLSAYTANPYNEKVLTFKAKNKTDYYHQVVDFIRSLPQSLIIVEVHHETELAVIIKKQLNNKVKVCLIKHGPTLYRKWHLKVPFIKKFQGKHTISKLTYLFSISNYCTNQFKKNYPEYSYKFLTLYNSYGYLDVNSIPTNDYSNYTIGFVGKPLKIKGFDYFIEATNKFIQKFSQWNINIVAAKFRKKKKYIKLLEEVKSNPNLPKDKIKIFTQLPRDEVMQVLSKTTIYIVPSKFIESFGLATLEAHLAGCIVISSGSGGLKEVSGDYAYYLPKLDSNNIYKVLEYINSHLDEAITKAKAGKARALEKFNPKHLVRQFDNIREKLLNE